MNLFSNKNWNLIVLSSGLLILIIAIFFPNIFGKRPAPIQKEGKEIVQIKTQSNDTSLDSIKNDLDATQVDNVDKELNTIENELNASI